MKKIIYRLLILIFLITFGFITYLSTIGIKTDRFNNQISNEVKKINNELVLNLNKINIILDPFKFKLNLKTIGTNIKYKNKIIKLESIKSSVDLKTLLNDEFSLSELNIRTRSLEVKNLISFIRLFDHSVQLFIFE